LFFLEKTLYLFFKGDDEKFKAQKLHANGTKLAEKESTEITINNINGNRIFSSWHLKRGAYHYLIYSEDLVHLRVARSRRGPLGPYEAMKGSLVPERFWEPCVVAGVNEQLVLIFGDKDGVYANKLRWDDDWPAIIKFETSGKWIKVH